MFLFGFNGLQGLTAALYDIRATRIGTEFRPVCPDTDVPNVPITPARLPAPTAALGSAELVSRASSRVLGRIPAQPFHSARGRRVEPANPNAAASASRSSGTARLQNQTSRSESAPRNLAVGSTDWR